MKKRLSVLMALLMLVVLLGSTGVVFADEDLGTWENKADMPTARYGLGVAEVNGKIYAIGGRNKAYDWFATVEEYDPSTNTWTTKTEMPTKRGDAGVIEVNGKIYVIGGRSAAGDSYYGIVEEYDPVADTWTVKASMPTPRDSLCVAEVNGKIYAIGGNSPTGFKSTVEEYDPLTDTWTTKTSMSTPRFNFGIAKMNEKIYVFGGTRGGAYLDTIEEYDPATDTWMTKSNNHTERIGLGATTVNEKIYVIGGWNSQSFNTVEEYDPVNDTFTIKANMPTARDSFGLTEYNGSIYVVGGKNDSDLGTVEVYTPNSTQQTPDAPTNLIATPGDSQVNLSWDAVTDATSYTVKRATTLGGPYTTIRTNSAITYSDTDVTNGTTYYYVVSAVVNSTESNNSNEASATPQIDVQNFILSVLLNVEETVQLSLTYDLVDNTDYIWTSSDEAVATVDSNGKVTAIGEGTANIYAKNDDESFSEFIPVKVVLNGADEMRLAVHLTTGRTAQLYLTDDTGNITWSSGDTSIATVSDEGEITALNKGLVLINAELDEVIYPIYVRVDV